MSTKRLPANARPRPAEFVITRRHVWVDPDVTLEDILRPAFWAHHANSSDLNPGDLVDVVARDFSLDVQLRVISKEPGLVMMRVLRSDVREVPKAAPQPTDDELPDLPDNYKVVYAPKAGWVARTVAPPETVATKKTKPEAYQAALDHARKAESIPA